MVTAAETLNDKLIEIGEQAKARRILKQAVTESLDWPEDDRTADNINARIGQLLLREMFEYRARLLQHCKETTSKLEGMIQEDE